MSTILLISTVVLIQIIALYTKGVNGANLQNTTRAVLADISASLQFSGSVYEPADHDLTGSHGIVVKGFCIGTNRYSYVEDRKLGDDHDSSGTVTNTPHVLWRDTRPSVGPCTPLDITNPGVPSGTDGYEMVPEHVRIYKMELTLDTNDTDVTNVSVGLAYGDRDLFRPDTGKITNCNDGTGTQYCGTAELSNTIRKRIQ